MPSKATKVDNGVIVSKVGLRERPTGRGPPPGLSFIRMALLLPVRSGLKLHHENTSNEAAAIPLVD